MKRGLSALVFILSSSMGYGASVFLQEAWIEQRGKEQFRDTLLWRERSLEGQSGSNQYVEFARPIGTEDKKENNHWNGHAFFMGTNSNLKKNPNIYLGTSFGFFRGREKAHSNDWNEKTRTYGINVEIAHIKENRLALLGLGFTEMRHTLNWNKRYREKEAHIFGEIGKVYSYDNSHYLYPFVAFSTQKGEGEKVVSDSEVGFRYTRYWTEKLSGKFQTSYRREWTQRRDEDRYQNRLDFLMGISYRYYEDLEIQLQYRGNVYKKAYQDCISLGFSHNF